MTSANDGPARMRLPHLALCLGVTGAALAGPRAPGNSAAEEITRSPWLMHIDPQPYGSLGFRATKHGEVAVYKFAKIPAVGDSSWQGAPDPDVIHFDGTKIGPDGQAHGGAGASRLTGRYPCLTAVDYTYFQTMVNVPQGGKVNTFTVHFNVIDDGARITIFNSAYPEGVLVPGSYVELGGSGTSDLAEYMRVGLNRVVITQVDDCPVGNTLGEGSIVLNGEVVAVSDEPVAPPAQPEPPAEPADEPAAEPANEPKVTPAQVVRVPKGAPATGAEGPAGGVDAGLLAVGALLLGASGASLAVRRRTSSRR